MLDFRICPVWFLTCFKFGLKEYDISYVIDGFLTTLSLRRTWIEYLRFFSIQVVTLKYYSEMNCRPYFFVQHFFS